MESDRPIDDAVKEYVAARSVPDIPSPNDPGRPIMLCYDCWDKAGRPEAEEKTGDVIFEWAKEEDRALYQKLTHCERCGVKFAFVKD
jgi:hypothetical protein